MDFKTIAMEGKYLYPANKERFGTISCDKCNKKNINACINYSEYDLCLMCADLIISEINQNPITNLQPIIPINNTNAKYTDDHCKGLSDFLKHEKELNNKRCNCNQNLEKMPRI